MTEMTAVTTAPLIIDLAFDVICPWCWIGKRHLDAALIELRVQQPNVAVQIRWQPVQLLPQMPIEGMPFLAFYIPRLGGFEAVHRRQAQVRSAAEVAGLQIAFERIDRMPNTARAHALLRHVASERADAYASMLERLFAGHFQRGESLGDIATLLAIAAEFDLASDTLHTALTNARAVIPPSQGLASQGVPHYRFNDGFDLTGAQAPAALLAAMMAALPALPADDERRVISTNSPATV